MSSVTATADQGTSLVRVDADLSDVGPDALRITRVQGGAATVIRPYGPTSAVTRWWTTANANPTFETNIASWTALGAATLAQSGTEAYRGSQSLRITATATAGPGAESDASAAIPGVEYGWSVWVWSANLIDFLAGIRWYDSAAVLISTTIVKLTADLGTLPASWTLVQGTAVAPEGAATKSLVCRYPTDSSPGAGVIWYVDEARLLDPLEIDPASLPVTPDGILTAYDGEGALDDAAVYAVTGWRIDGTWASQAGSEVTSGGAQVSSGGRVFLRDPVRPGALLRANPGVRRRGCGPGEPAWLGLSDLSRKAIGSLFTVQDSPYPVATTRVRQEPSWQTSFLVRTPETIAEMREMVAPGSVLLLQVPGKYQLPDSYLLVGDVTEGRLGGDARRIERVFALPVQRMQAPAGPSAGPDGARFTDLAAHHATWGELTAGTAGAWDSFGRTVAAGSWGSTESGSGGGSYALTGTATDFSVSAGRGQIGVSAVNSTRTALVGSGTDQDIYLSVVPPVIATGAAYQVGIAARRTDASNYYRFILEFGLLGVVTPRIVKRVAGVETTVASGATATYTAGQEWRIHALLAGTFLAIATWPDLTSAEPDIFTASATDAALAGPGSFGAFARLVTGNTNTLPVAVQCDDLLYALGPSWSDICDGVTA